MSGQARVERVVRVSIGINIPEREFQMEEMAVKAKTLSLKQTEIYIPF